MKIGTDGVLLGAWSPIAQNINSVLDIGSGIGHQILPEAWGRCVRKVVTIHRLRKHRLASTQCGQFQ